MIRNIMYGEQSFKFNDILFTQSKQNLNHYKGEGLLALSPNISVKLILDLEYIHYNRTMNIFFTIMYTKLKGNMSVDMSISSPEYPEYVLKEIANHIRAEYITDLIKNH